MNSATSEAPKPRRKWGWLFVILFVAQAVVFAALIGTMSADIGRARGLASSFATRGDVTNAQVDNLRARALETQMRMLLVACGVFSLITIAGATIGFQRKK
jgi:hypothetical protein